MGSLHETIFNLCKEKGISGYRIHVASIMNITQKETIL